MFLAFHLPFEVRNAPDVYRWVTYKMMHHLAPEDVAFIGHPALFADPATLNAATDFALLPGVRSYFGYEVPSASRISAYRKHPINPRLFDALEALHGGPTLTWRSLLCTPYPPLVAAIRDFTVALDRESPVEAFLVWANCPSVDEVAHEFGIPVIHNELGPLRPPAYHMTGYFDLQGVNGGTEAERRFRRFARQYPDKEVLDRRQIWDLVAKHAWPEPVSGARAEVGLALQVPDDSNLVAFGHGFSNEELVRYAQRRHMNEDILVRPHPAFARAPYISGPPVDTSATSLEFLSRIKRLLTVNSSLLLEAALLELPAQALGESPFSAYAHHLEASQRGDDILARWRHFMVLGYLMPWSLMFDAAYYRFRLTNPAEHEIEARHWQAMMARAVPTGPPSP